MVQTTGWFYLPISLPGVVITLAALAFCVQVFFAIDRKSHSATDTLYGVFPFFACAFLLLGWAAERRPQIGLIPSSIKS